MLGYDPERVEVLLYQLVHLTRGGEATKMSKRRGDVVFLDEFLDEVGVDAARWYLVNRGHDQTIEIDVDLAAEKTPEEPGLLRPVRARADRRDPAERGRRDAVAPSRPPELAPEERDLVKRLAEFPASSPRRPSGAAPHAIPTYAIRVADDFHRFYHDHKVLGSRREAFRLGLCRATQLVIARASTWSASRRPSGCSAGRTRIRGRMSARAPDRNLALELVRVTEAAALAAVRLGRPRREGERRRRPPSTRCGSCSTPSRMHGVVVIGEGEKDEAPMLYNGEQVGDGSGPEVDVAVDPLEGTRLTALGQPNAIAVIAVAERGTMFFPGAAVYMDKIAVGPEAADAIDIDASPTENVRAVAKAKGLDVDRGDRRRPRARPARRR